jgi:hypothetical protein
MSGRAVLLTPISGDGSLLIRWELGRYDDYDFASLQIIDQTIGTVKTVNVSDTIYDISYNLTNLINGHQYYIAMSTYPVGTGFTGTPVLSNTVGGVPCSVPAAPVITSGVTALNPTTVNLTVQTGFNGGNDPTKITFYVFDSSNNNFNIPPSPVTLDISTNYIIPLTSPYITYEIMCNLTNLSGNSECSPLFVVPAAYSPAAPLITTLLSGIDGQCNVIWSASTSASVTSYNIYSYKCTLDASNNFVVLPTTVPSMTQYIVPADGTLNTTISVANGFLYYVAISSVATGAGEGVKGVGYYVLPYAAFGTITNYAVTSKNLYLIANWIAPTTPVTSFYNVPCVRNYDVNINSVDYITALSTISTTATLTNGVSYLCSLYGSYTIPANIYRYISDESITTGVDSNLVQSVTSSVYATPSTVPDQITTIRFLEDATTIDLYWVAPFDEGSAITSSTIYQWVNEADASNNVLIASGSALAASVTVISGNLPFGTVPRSNGQYARILSTNINGSGLTSNYITCFESAPLPDPRNFTASQSTNTIDLSFNSNLTVDSTTLYTVQQYLLYSLSTAGTYVLLSTILASNFDSSYNTIPATVENYRYSSIQQIDNTGRVLNYAVQAQGITNEIKDATGTVIQAAGLPVVSQYTYVSYTVIGYPVISNVSTPNNSAGTLGSVNFTVSNTAGSGAITSVLIMAPPSGDYTTINPFVVYDGAPPGGIAVSGGMYYSVQFGYPFLQSPSVQPFLITVNNSLGMNYVENFST